MLYRKTLKDSTTGVNSFSNPEIKLTDFKTFPLGKNKIGVIMAFKDPESGLERRIASALFLSNGFVVNESSL